MSTLNPVEIESIEDSYISWTKTEKSQDSMKNSSTPLPTIPTESNFQPEHHELKKQSIILQDTQVPQEARDKLSSILDNEFDIIVSMSSTDVGRTSLLKMGIPTTGPPIAWKPYLIALKHQNFIDKEIHSLEDVGCTSESLSTWAALVIIVPKKPDSLHPQKSAVSLNFRLPFIT